MFENISEKIKSFAKIVCWVEIIAVLIIAITMFIMVNEGPSDTEGLYLGLGFAFLFLGPIYSLLSNFCIYGFGELLEKISDINRKLSVTSGIPNIDHNKIKILNNLKNKGLINDEEYAEKIKQLQGE